ncbi:hypothetical protein ACFSUD_08120 [Sulfitobacter aestuarii]|uniref:CMD domain protein n=1 Tax=Sulfitobacter aestuarii TaxID=2161676 RepID=A0ABW5U1M7_9RHOB
MSDIFGMTSLRLGGVSPQSATGKAAASRAKVLELTQAAEDAVLAPEDCGGISADLRAALAARIARLNGDEALAAHYAARIVGDATLADPAQDGAAQGVAAMVAFMDKVAAKTAGVAAGDVSALQSAGVSDADIVRLAELNAFLAYQIRLIAGLRLMEGAGA